MSQQFVDELFPDDIKKEHSLCHSVCQNAGNDMWMTRSFSIAVVEETLGSNSNRTLQNPKNRNVPPIQNP